MRFRFQYGGDARAVSDANMTAGGGEQLVRPEFAPETDIGNMLKRHGAFPPGRDFPTGGEVDYDVRLGDALALVREARESYSRLPDELRRRYPGWEEVMAAAARGDIEVVDGVPRVAVKRAESPVEQPNRPE